MEEGWVDKHVFCDLPLDGSMEDLFMMYFHCILNYSQLFVFVRVCVCVCVWKVCLFSG